MPKTKNYVVLELPELTEIERSFIAQQQALSAESAQVQRQVLGPIRAKALKLQGELDKVAAAKSIAAMAPAEREALVAAVGGGA